MEANIDWTGKLQTCIKKLSKLLKCIHVSLLKTKVKAKIALTANWFPFLMLYFKDSTPFLYFTSSGAMYQIFAATEPRKIILKCFGFTVDLEKSVWDFKVYRG